MLTFKRGSYNRDEIISMHEALVAAKNQIKCTHTQCNECENRKPCGDIARCKEFLLRLLEHMAD